MKYPIPATFYALPNGKVYKIFLDAGEEVFFEKAMTIIKSGFNFECEVLTTNEVSLTIIDSKRERDVAIEISRNNKNNQDMATKNAFQKLILNFNLEKPNA